MLKLLKSELLYKLQKSFSLVKNTSYYSNCDLLIPFRFSIMGKVFEFKLMFSCKINYLTTKNILCTFIHLLQSSNSKVLLMKFLQNEISNRFRVTDQLETISNIVKSFICTKAEVSEASFKLYSLSI